MRPQKAPARGKRLRRAGMMDARRARALSPEDASIDLRCAATMLGTMRKLFFGLVSLGVVGGFLIPACNTPGISLSGPNFDGGDGAIPQLRGVGQSCDEANVCRPGLACNGGTCAPGRSLEEGADCVISAECKDGLYCSPLAKCAPAGSGGDGAACSSDADCKSTFRCNVVSSEISIQSVCQPEGNVDLGGQCQESAQCFGSLYCAENVCGKIPPGVSAFQVQCPAAEAGPVTAYFRVPRGSDDGDFFRLPWPNDIRKKGGRPDLAGFPTPGPGPLKVDVVDRWARHLEKTNDGYSGYPSVVFRFSGEIDYTSLEVDGASDFIDLTTGDANAGYQWSVSTGRTAYVCENNLTFRPRMGEPLKPGHTYAFLLTNKVMAKDGTTPVAAPADLTAILGASDPGGPLSAAYAAYAPLRAWAASKSFNLATVTNAAVFTVGHHDDVAKKLASTIAAAPAPTATNWVKCGGGTPSPCAQAEGDRACPATADPAFDELHAIVKLPNFQQGNLPYIKPEDGGDLVVTESAVTSQGTIDVCLSLTVPKEAAMPVGGWPLVIYGHGTGGSFRSHVSDASGRLSNAPDGKHIAVLGIDQVAHGTRRGTSTEKPENLFFNFLNPAAARGNVLQGAADQMSLVRFAKAVNILAASSPTGADIRFDTIAFWGHSQGATEGSVAMPYITDVKGVLYSGLGASLIDSLLSKKKPVDISAVVPFLLSEAPANVTAYHPILSMLQNAIDPADALNHASAMTTPSTPSLAKHVFFAYGQGDTYAPVQTQQTYVFSARLGVAAAPSSVTSKDDLGAEVAVPFGANVAGNTAVVRQYAKPADADGHFVVFRDANARTNADRYLVDVLTAAAAPQVGR